MNTISKYYRKTPQANTIGAQKRSVLTMARLATRLQFDMHRSIFLFIAAIIALLRVFVLGMVAVLFGMGSVGAVQSALLRIFQLYGVLFVYLIILQYAKPEARKFLRRPTIIIETASLVLSAIALISFIRNSGSSFPTDFVKAGSSMVALVMIDVVLVGLLGFDALKFPLAPQHSASSAPSAPTATLPSQMDAPPAAPNQESRDTIMRVDNGSNA